MKGAVLHSAVLAALVIPCAAATVVAAQDRSGEAAARAVMAEGVRSLEAGDVEQAIRRFERALRLSPEDVEIYLYLARAHGAAGRTKEALNVLANGEIHARDSRKLRYKVELLRGDLHRDAGDREQAREAYLRAAKLRAFNREARRRIQALDEEPGPAAPE